MRRQLEAIGLKRKKKDVRCCFVHIPKTAGSAVVSALKRCGLFRDSISIDLYDTRKMLSFFDRSHYADQSKPVKRVLNSSCCFTARDCIVAHEAIQDRDLISGHFQYSQELANLMPAQYDWLTVLRHPVERFLSQYEYSTDHVSEFSQFLKTDLAERYSAYLRYYLAGPRWMMRSHTNPEGAVQQALDNLVEFKVIGFQDQMGRFEEQFQESYGVKLRLQKINQNKRSLFWSELNVADKRALEGLCAPDLVIYEQARKRFG